MNAVRVVGLLLVLLSQCAQAQEHHIGEGIRPDSAPRTLPDAPDVLEVAHGLVWVRLADGSTTASATKVPAGVYLTAEAWGNASGAFSARGARIADLERQLQALSVEPAAPVLPACPACPTPQPGRALQEDKPFPWVAVLLVGVAGFAGGLYVGVRAAR